MRKLCSSPAAPSSKNGYDVMGVYPVPYPAQLFTVLPHREHCCSNIIVVFFRLLPSQSVDATKPLARLHNQRKVIPTDPANCFNARRTLKGAVYTITMYTRRACMSRKIDIYNRLSPECFYFRINLVGPRNPHNPNSTSTATHQHSCRFSGGNTIPTHIICKTNLPDNIKMTVDSCTYQVVN